jgi:uncharacterized membrane protein YhiD involved in acid resistance
MEELKLLIGMVADLPQMALWVLIGFLIYKLAVIGSIFGVIKLAIDRLHNFAVTRKELPPINQEIHLEDILNGITISSDDTKQQLIRQLKRVAGKGTQIETQYIHRQSVDWLRVAIDAKEEADKK